MKKRTLLSALLLLTLTVSGCAEAAPDDTSALPETTTSITTETTAPVTTAQPETTSSPETDAPTGTSVPDLIDLAPYAAPPSDSLFADAYILDLETTDKNGYGRHLRLQIPRINSESPNAAAWNRTQVDKWFGSEISYGTLAVKGEWWATVISFEQTCTSVLHGDILVIDVMLEAGGFSHVNTHDIYYYNTKTDTFLTLAEFLPTISDYTVETLLAECSARHLGKTDIGEGEITEELLSGVIPEGDGFTLWYRLPDAAIAVGTWTVSAAFD
ncbi:MAG: hypothetical protein IJ493_02345 [Clostridia bacterium]|nr:hypothetical protein [Clostridia bacterium]